MIITIVIPLYNKESLIRRTLKSVAAGDTEDCEIVVVDDGSTDGSAAAALAAAQEFGLENFRIVTQRNGGVAKARNRGIAEAKGEYVAFIDADDEWKPDHITTLKQLVNDYPSCAVFATGYDDVTANGLVVHNEIKTYCLKVTAAFWAITLKSLPNPCRPSGHRPLWLAARR